MKKQSFIKGSVILITSALIAKAIGALFKIPITNMLGGLGMSCFSGAYGLFLPIYAVTANGLTTSAAKLTAESCAKGDYDGIRRIHRTALLMFSAMGIVGCLVIAILSVPFAEKAAVCPEAWLSVLMIAPSALFGCITAVYRGVREGMSDMYPTALSQVIESLVRLTAGLGLCHYVITHAEAVLSFLPKGTTIESAAAAAAVLGISLSTLVGTLFLRVSGTGLPKTAKRIKPDRKTAKALMKIFVPVALGAAAANLTTLIDQWCAVLKKRMTALLRFLPISTVLPTIPHPSLSTALLWDLPSPCSTSSLPLQICSARAYCPLSPPAKPKGILTG